MVGSKDKWDFRSRHFSFVEEVGLNSYLLIEEVRGTHGHGRDV